MPGLPSNQSSEDWRIIQSDPGVGAFAATWKPLSEVLVHFPYSAAGLLRTGPIALVAGVEGQRGGRREPGAGPGDGMCLGSGLKTARDGWLDAAGVIWKRLSTLSPGAGWGSGASSGPYVGVPGS